jgi:Holliday junction resolvase RusA-like endonuclease
MEEFEVEKSKNRTFLLSFLFDIPPSTNSIYNYGRGRIYHSKKYKEYKANLQKLLLSFKKKMVKNNKSVALSILVAQPRRTGDIDNRLKSLLDTLQGFIYENDKQVSEINLIRIYSKKPYIKVFVEEIEDYFSKKT